VALQEQRAAGLESAEPSARARRTNRPANRPMEFRLRVFSWRLPTIITVFLVGLVVAVGILVATKEGLLEFALGILAFGGLIWLIWYLLFFKQRIFLMDRGIRVRGPLAARRARWDDITSFEVTDQAWVILRTQKGKPLRILLELWREPQRLHEALVAYLGQPTPVTQASVRSLSGRRVELGILAVLSVPPIIFSSAIAWAAGVATGIGTAALAVWNEPRSFKGMRRVRWLVNYAPTILGAIAVNFITMGLGSDSSASALATFAYSVGWGLAHSGLKYVALRRRLRSNVDALRPTTPPDFPPRLHR